MEEEEDREDLLKTLSSELRKDSTKSVVVGMSGLGLVEVTRKKLGTNISSWLQQPCQYCNGSGSVLSAETVALRIRKEIIERIRFDPTRNSISVTAHPDVIKLLAANYAEDRAVTEEIAQAQITYKEDPHIHIEQYRIKNI